MKLTKLFSIIFFTVTGFILCSQPTHAATITAVQSGNWSDVTTWSSATLPVKHDTVVIPAGLTVNYDQISDDVIDLLTINGTLTFSTTTNTRLTIDEADVFGTWQMGTATAPIPSIITTQVKITGDMEMIASYSGTFEVHGATRNSTWTRLAKTAERNTHKLQLQQPVDWQVGDSIVIASTSYIASEAETRTITAISATGKVITLGKKLDYKHYGANHEFAEVGLLSHNIQFSGDDEYDAGHIMFMGNSTAHVADASFDTLGTYATLAQYPLHFHLVGDAAGSYIKRVAITNSSNRCITLHGTSNVLVQDNVAYNTKGHCYFLEDGVEEGNQFIHNLGVYTRAGATLDSDSKPATFWITNPKNTYRKNSAAGSEGFGYWFFVLNAATGLSADSTIVPNQLRLQKFSHNTTHSNAEFGFNIDGQGFGSVYYTPTTTAVFDHITSYKNASTGIWARGRNLKFTHALVLDNRIGVSFAANNATLTRSTVIGESGNDSTEGWMPYKYGFAFYDGPIHLRHTTFKNFVTEGDQTQVAVTMQPNNPYAMSPDSSFSDLHFKHAQAFHMNDVTRAGEMFAVWNNDDTGEVYLPLLAFHNNGCRAQTVWNLYICPAHDYGRLFIGNVANTPDQLSVTRLDTNTATTMTAEGSSSNGNFFLNLPTNVAYRFDQGNSDGLKLYWSQSTENITVRIPYANRPSSITERGLSEDHWTYDSNKHEVVLELQPDREYIVHQ